MNGDATKRLARVKEREECQLLTIKEGREQSDDALYFLVC